MKASQLIDTMESVIKFCGHQMSISLVEALPLLSYSGTTLAPNIVSVKHRCWCWCFHGGVEGGRGGGGQETWNQDRGV